MDLISIVGSSLILRHALREKKGEDAFCYEMLSMLYNVDKVESGVYILSNANLSDKLYVKTNYYIFSDLEPIRKVLLL